MHFIRVGSEASNMFSSNEDGSVSVEGQIPFHAVKKLSIIFKVLLKAGYLKNIYFLAYITDMQCVELFVFELNM